MDDRFTYLADLAVSDHDTAAVGNRSENHAVGNRFESLVVGERFERWRWTTAVRL